MKTKESFISGAFILAIFVFVLIFVDFLALMDIHQDYVSQKVLELIQVDITDKLPDWASTNLEWNFIRLSLMLKSVFMVIIIIALAKAVRK
jgi:hypothetical protein